MSGRGALWLAAGLALLAPGSAAAELKARSTVQSDDLIAHQSAEWRVTLEGSGTVVPEPEFTPPDWAEITAAGTEQSVRFDNTGMKSAVIYRFLVVPARAGRFQLPPVTLRVGRNRVTTPAVPVTVLREALPSGGAASGTGALRLVVSLDRERCVLGEAVRMTVRFYQATRLAERQFWGPATPGFWAEPISAPRSYYAQEGGRRWLVTESHSFLYPTVIGTLTLGTARMLCLVERDQGSLTSPFRIGTPGEEVIAVESAPVRLVVSDLPAGRPAGFEGGVGSFSLALAAERDSIRADETLDVTVRLGGEGNLRVAGLPEWGELADFESYGRAVEDSIDLEGAIPRGTRRIQLSLLPRRQGVLTLPGLTYAVYTPGKGYQRLSVPGRRIVVRPPLGLLGGASAVEPLGAPSGVVRPPRPTPGWLLAALGVSGLSWAVGLLARRASRRLAGRESSPAGVRGELAALARAQRVEEYLRAAERWLSGPAPARGDAGARDVVLARVRALRYGGRTGDSGFADLAAAVERLLRAAERQARPGGAAAAWMALVLAVGLIVAGVAYGVQRTVEGRADAPLTEVWGVALRNLAEGRDTAAEAALDSLWRAEWRGGTLAAQASLAALRGRRLGRAALWIERARREDADHPFVRAVRQALDEEGALPGHPEGVAARVPARQLALAALSLLALGQVLWARALAGRGAWRLAGGATVALAVAGGVTGFVVSRAGYGERAGVIVRATPLLPEPGAEAELDLEPGRLVEAHEAREGHRRIGLGGGLTGWVREGDVVAVRSAPEKPAGTAGGTAAGGSP